MPIYFEWHCFIVVLDNYGGAIVVSLDSGLEWLLVYGPFDEGCEEWNIMMGILKNGCKFGFHGGGKHILHNPNHKVYIMVVRWYWGVVGFGWIKRY
jgi:hypothetical protein